MQKDEERSMRDLSKEEKAKICEYFIEAVDNSLTDLQKKFNLKRSTAYQLTERALAKRTASGKKIFVDSKWSNEVEVAKQLNGHQIYGRADVIHYIEAVMNWSMGRTTPMKRTDRGWLATIRQFILSDHGKGKMVETPTSHGGFRNL